MIAYKVEDMCIKRWCMQIAVYTRTRTHTRTPMQLYDFTFVCMHMRIFMSSLWAWIISREGKAVRVCVCVCVYISTVCSKSVWLSRWKSCSHAWLVSFLNLKDIYFFQLQYFVPLACENLNSYKKKTSNCIWCAAQNGN